MSQYLREHWGSDRGFPRGPVYAISQSNDGYLWIGTRAGLIRFDGASFRLIKDVPGLANKQSVYGLTTDGDGNLWISADGETLVRYHDGVFERPLAPTDS